MGLGLRGLGLDGGSAGAMAGMTTDGSGVTELSVMTMGVSAAGLASADFASPVFGGAWPRTSAVLAAAISVAGITTPSSAGWITGLGSGFASPLRTVER